MKRISKTKNSGNSKQSVRKNLSKDSSPERMDTHEIFKNLFFNCPAMMVITDANTGVVLEVNRQFVKFYGFRKKEIIGKTLKEMHAYVNPKDRDNIASIVMKKKLGKNFELWERTKNGEIKWVNASVQLISLFGRKCFLGSGIDITEKKIAEENLKICNNELEDKVEERTAELKKANEKLVKAEAQVRIFASHLNQVLEDERANIAREIHDELGQLLTGIKLGLSSFKKFGTANNQIESKATAMMIEVDNSIQALRKISTSLRPGILDTLGLIPSLGWLAKEFENRTGIHCRFELLSGENKEVAKNISITYFRVCQEALTNISKHAKASEVVIRINGGEKELALEVADNGKGISKDKLDNPFSMGLLCMRERANLIKANFNITSNKNSGTTIQLKTRLN